MYTSSIVEYRAQAFVRPVLPHGVDHPSLRAVQLLSQSMIVTDATLNGNVDGTMSVELCAIIAARRQSRRPRPHPRR